MCFHTQPQYCGDSFILTVCKQQPQEWHSYVLMMAKHKCFEKMEQLDKQDTEDLTDDDFHAYKDCAEAIKHMLEIEQRMHLE